ncbi:MAG TPA: precorrin-6y C5,15-methyltransferase (decarboxylating) subunit CbiE [Acidimicrobiia bacterium]|nr:precorrin-6y C5,15-methyltransferase (decarboxylating) subunit CbiE [Acidimicrobiia bacterium]
MSRGGVAPITVVGFLGTEWFGRGAEAALRSADVLLGVRRLLDALPDDIAGKRVELAGPLADTLELAAERRALGERVCVLASGDPGFFGIVRVASARFGADALVVHPAPSSVAAAFGRVGLHWDDAVVVSAHGRALSAAVEAVLPCAKAAVLTAPDQPPEALGRALLDAGCRPRRVTVCARLGHADESVTRTDLEGLAAGSFPHLAVVILEVPSALDRSDPEVTTSPTLAWGRPDAEYSHRAGMITKAEVRAVVLGKLALPATGVLWDVGAGSGSVAVECSRLAPGLRVFAVERRPDDAERLRLNVAGTGVVVVEGDAPAALAGLPDPDRVFVGGGGLDVLEFVLGRLRPGGLVVATYAALDRAAGAASRLGHVVQVAVSRGVPLGGSGALRLAAENPVFVCWGPSPEPGADLGLEPGAESGLGANPHIPPDPGARTGSAEAPA